MSNIALSNTRTIISYTCQAQELSIGTYAVPVAIACSLSFMLPMADPAVAMAYGTGYVKIKEILKAESPVIMGLS